MDPWDDRARQAADSVTTLFGRRLLGLPGTLLPLVRSPGRRDWSGPWHYWWLAHYLDALIDGVLRECGPGGDPKRADTAYRYAVRLLRTIRLRNVGTFVNHYYDDMAWLLLAAHRLDQLDPSPLRLARAAGRALTTTVLKADTPDLGGGLFWNDTHDFKNVPATAPAAIFFARTGRRARAAAHIDWIYANLHDPRNGLILDGLAMQPDGGIELVGHIFTYNQGTVLGALIELGDPRSLDRAAALIDAISTQQTSDPEHHVLGVHGDGDGGLFTGIAVRYLALAAQHPQLDPAARATARSLVLGTASALWKGRQTRSTPKTFGMPSGPVLVFSPDPAVPADESQPPGIPVELSSQVQAWTILEAAATLTPQRR